jgi:YD repeat-containing protein
VAMASVTSQCTTLTYDKNGNRLSQTVAPMTSTTTTWGAATYGCFVWKQ